MSVLRTLAIYAPLEDVSIALASSVARSSNQGGIKTGSLDGAGLQTGSETAALGRVDGVVGADVLGLLMLVVAPTRLNNNYLQNRSSGSNSRHHSNRRHWTAAPGEQRDRGCRESPNRARRWELARARSRAGRRWRAELRTERRWREQPGWR